MTRYLPFVDIEQIPNLALVFSKNYVVTIPADLGQELAGATVSPPS